ncbi:hypothetical protein B0H13DRAFT_2301088 [Mycena leptocephala]|nr:hypothetical protein B0H13DRAFT_2301088 [Mycena leptocephala]
METALAPTYANLFLAAPEVSTLKEFKDMLLYYGRNIDDVFSIIVGDLDAVLAFQERFGRLHPNMKIEWTSSRVQLPFLDVHVSLEVPLSSPSRQGDNTLYYHLLYHSGTAQALQDILADVDSIQASILRHTVDDIACLQLWLAPCIPLSPPDHPLLPDDADYADAGTKDNTDTAQSSTVTLSTLGIKVRDFFYESTLSPIAPCCAPGLVRHQISPSGTNKPRPLKRTQPDGTGLEYGFVMGVPRARPQKRQRTATLPVPHSTESGEAAIRRGAHLDVK